MYFDLKTKEERVAQAEKVTKSSIELIHKIYKKTLAYKLESIRVNEDGTTTHLHSDKFLDEHPERRNSPEFTEDEEKKQAEFFGKFVEVNKVY